MNINVANEEMQPLIYYFDKLHEETRLEPYKDEIPKVIIDRCLTEATNNKDLKGVTLTEEEMKKYQLLETKDNKDFQKYSQYNYKKYKLQYENKAGKTDNDGLKNLNPAKQKEVEVLFIIILTKTIIKTYYQLIKYPALYKTTQDKKFMTTIKQSIIDLFELDKMEPEKATEMVDRLASSSFKQYWYAHCHYSLKRILTSMKKSRKVRKAGKFCFF